MSKRSPTKGPPAGSLQDTGAGRAALLPKDPAFLYRDGKIRELLPDSGVHPHLRPLFPDPPHTGLSREGPALHTPSHPGLEEGLRCFPPEGRKTPGSPLLTRPGSNRTGQQMTNSDQNGAWLETQFSPKPWLCCSPHKGTACPPQTSVPVRPQGPHPQLQGAPVRFPKTTSERYQCHSDTAPSRVATGAHNHLQHSLHVYVYHQRCEGDRFQFSYVLSQAAR